MRSEESRSQTETRSMKRALRIMPAVITLAVASFAAGTLLFAQAVPTFVGVRTFMGAPYVPRLDALEADFAVLGVPFDEGTWGQPGARYGPRDLRENSQEYHHDLTEGDRKSTRLNSSHGYISYAVFCLKKKKRQRARRRHATGSLHRDKL